MDIPKEGTGFLEHISIALFILNVIQQHTESPTLEQTLGEQFYGYQVST